MSAQLGNWMIPLLLAGVFLYASGKGVPVFECFTQGAKEGIGSAFRILPPLVALCTAIGMLRASGALDLLCLAVAPLGQLVGLPPPLFPLALVRPLSASSAMAVFRDVLTHYGPDGFIGRVASVMMGASETTVYTLAIYYGATRVKDTRHTLTAGLLGDLTVVLTASFVVRWLLGTG